MLPTCSLFSEKASRSRFSHGSTIRVVRVRARRDALALDRPALSRLVLKPVRSCRRDGNQPLSVDNIAVGQLSQGGGWVRGEPGAGGNRRGRPGGPQGPRV